MPDYVLQAFELCVADGKCAHAREVTTHTVSGYSVKRYEICTRRKGHNDAQGHVYEDVRKVIPIA